MPPKIIKVKNLEQNKLKTVTSKIDPISTFFLIFLSFVGWNRFRVFNVNKIISKLTVIYSISLNITLCYLSLKWRTNIYMECVNVVNVISFLSCSFLNYKFTNKFRAFYEDLHTFDLITGYNLKIDKSAIQNTRLCVTYIMFLSVTYVILISLNYLNESAMCLAVIYVIFNIEQFYYGHLFAILLPRIQILRKILSTYFLEGKNSKIYEKREIKDVVLFYGVLIKAYDNLNAAIKYQVIKS